MSRVVVQSVSQESNPNSQIEYRVALNVLRVPADATWPYEAKVSDLPADVRDALLDWLNA